MKCKKCPIHPLGLLIIIIGVAMCVVSHTSVFSKPKDEETARKSFRNGDDNGDAEITPPNKHSRTLSDPFKMVLFEES
jgi:hypothetical protein